MNLAPKPIQRLPVIVISGFLGSGKTTLLNQLLKSVPRSAVIINEFGTTPIDQQLLRDHQVPLSTLVGGCLCCQVRGSFSPLLKNLRMAWESKADKPFDRVIIETSGVANPEPILDIFLKKSWLSERYHLQGLISTISAVTGAETLARFADAKAQIAWADTVVITHSDAAKATQLQTLETRLQELSPAAKKLYAIKGELEPDDLLVFTEKFRYLRTAKLPELPDHGFNSITLQFDEPFLWERLQSALLKLTERFGDRLVRLKGVMYTREFEQPLIIQGTGYRLYPSQSLAVRASDDGKSRLVLIMVGETNEVAEYLMSQLRQEDIGNG